MGPETEMLTGAMCCLTGTRPCSRAETPAAVVSVWREVVRLSAGLGRVVAAEDKKRVVNKARGKREEEIPRGAKGRKQGEKAQLSTFDWRRRTDLMRRRGKRNGLTHLKPRVVAFWTG